MQVSTARRAISIVLLVSDRQPLGHGASPDGDRGGVVVNPVQRFESRDGKLRECGVWYAYPFKMTHGMATLATHPVPKDSAEFGRLKLANKEGR